MFFSARSRAFRPHASHTASKLPVKISFSAAAEPEGKMFRGPWQAVPKLCAAHPLRFNWHSLEDVVELCVGDFLNEFVYNLRKHIKHIVFLTFWFYQWPSQNWFSFFLRISSQRGAHFLLTRHFFSGPVVRFQGPGQPAEGNGKA